MSFIFTVGTRRNEVQYKSIYGTTFIKLKRMKKAWEEGRGVKYSNPPWLRY